MGGEEEGIGEAAQHTGGGRMNTRGCKHLRRKVFRLYVVNNCVSARCYCTVDLVYRLD
jgi:hypothetical protein